MADLQDAPKDAPQDESEPLRRLDRWLRATLAVCVALTLALGIAKVYWQKEHHPASYDKPVHVFEGYMAIDGHAAVAAAFRDWWTGEDPGGRALRQRLAASLHPSAVVVPFLVGTLGAVAGSIPVAFWLLTAAATCAQVWLASILCARAGGDRAADRRLAALLTCGHIFTTAACAQLYLDPFVAVLASGACVLASRWMVRGDAASAALLAGVQVLGLFTKVSYAPLLALPLLAVATSRQARTYGKLALAAGLFAGLPWIAWWLYLRWMGDSSLAGRESEHLWGSWKLQPSQLLAFLAVMILLFQAFPWFAFDKTRARFPAIHVIRCALFLLLVATWAFRLPAVHRLYLPEVAMLGALAAPAIVTRFKPERMRVPVGVYLAANYTLAIVLLVRGGS